MRKRRAVKRDVLPDAIYNSKIVTKLINQIMNDGKKGTAQKIVYDAFDIIKEKSRSEGHKAGAETLEKIILYISKEKIANYLSLYVFSTENFSRSPEEVNYLMELFMKWFKKCKEKYKNANIKVLFSAQKEFLKSEIVKAIDELEEATKDNTGLVVNFCLSYGGRQEIVDATKKIATDVLENK